MRMVMGAKTAVSTAEATSTQVMSENVADPPMRPRTAVTRWLTGLTSTTACRPEGMVLGSTKMFDAKVSGMITIIDTPMTAFGLRITRPRIVNTQLRENAKTKI